MPEIALPSNTRAPDVWSQRWKTLRYVVAENPLSLAAFVLFALFVLLALVGPTIAPYDALASNVGTPLSPPSANHWFGTDALGRDILSRVMSRSTAGSRYRSGGGGSLVRDRRTRRCLRRLLRGMDRTHRRAHVGHHHGVSALRPRHGHRRRNGQHGGEHRACDGDHQSTVLRARCARRIDGVLRNAAFVEAARLAGNNETRLLFHHIIPNILPPMMVQVSLNMGWAILNAAGLSFIGLGVRPPAAEWGIMVAEGAQYIVSGEWWIALFPGAVLMLAVFCFNLLGDSLRDLVDPRRRT
jgi:peptide/nickel transport system permease protein